VLNLLERDEYHEFRLAEIRDHLIEGGLMEDTPRARHALEMTVVNMTKRGELERPRKGFYKIAQGDVQAPVLTSVHCEDDEVR